MGRVYRALDNNSGQDVAVKILRGDLCKKGRSRRRFAREAQYARMLNHPGIVRVFDYSETPRPYLVMELLNGLSLRRYIRTNKCTILQILDLAVQICAALAHAHSHGVIHRDLKPDNINVNAVGQVKILDFGLARLANADMSALTKAGTALGTCSYMAPEQASGKEADERSDLYSLGVILYEFICGMTPFSADEPAQVLYMQVHQQPEHPRDVDPSIPQEVEGLILWLLNKNPIHRPQTANQLRQKIIDIVNYLQRSGQVVSPKKPSLLLPEEAPVRVLVNTSSRPTEGFPSAEPMCPAEPLSEAPARNLAPRENVEFPGARQAVPAMRREPEMAQPMRREPEMAQPMRREPEMAQPMRREPELAQPMRREPELERTLACEVPPAPARPEAPPIVQRPNPYFGAGASPAPRPYGNSRGRALVSGLNLHLEKISHLCHELPGSSLGEIAAEILSAFDESIKRFGGRILSISQNDASAIFTGEQNGLRAAQAAKMARRQLELIKLSHGINGPTSLSAGVFSEAVNIGPDQALDSVQLENVLVRASRLEQIARGQGNETVISGESLTPEMQFASLRSIYVKGRAAPVYLYRVLALP